MNIKNYIKLILTLTIIAFSQNLKAQYCNSTAAYPDYEHISRVSYGEVDNETGSDLYTDYTNALSSDFYIGESYTLTIKTESYYTSDKIACWIDWNQDEVFSESEKIVLSFTGTPSQSGNATGTIIPPSDAVLGKTRMRILLVDGVNPEPCLSSTELQYGEVEDYSVNIIGIDAPPHANFTASKRIIYEGESVEFTDISTLVPTSWNWIITPSTVSFIEGTDANSKNPVITFNESGNYTITLEATNGIGTGDTTMVDYIQVKDFGAPRNINAETEGKHVNLTWDAPNISGLYNHVSLEDAQYIINPGPQRATKYSADDFNFTYPVTVTQVSAFFYQSSNDPWDDATFKFYIYDKDTVTILYESGELEAQHNKEYIYNLPSPLTLNNDFYLAIVPVSSSNNPSNLAEEIAPYATHTFVGEPGSWWQFTDETISLELTTSIYIAGDKSNILKYSYSNPEIVNEKAVVNFSLNGYEIYRNGSLIKQIDNKDVKSYIDQELTIGDYDYYVKAVYSPFGLSPASDTIQVHVDNTNPEIKLIFKDAELVSGSEIKFDNNVMLNQSESITIGIYNEGQNNLTIGTISIDNDEFSINTNPDNTIAGDDTSYFTITFTPLTDGVKTATITIENNDSNENPYTFNLRGVGGLDKWTWMVYMLEDNTGLNGAKDINEWEVNGSVSGQVNYIVLYDADQDSNDGIYYVTKDPEGFNYSLVSEKVSTIFGQDPDLSDPNILEDFLLWVKENYPAQHYGLTMWDHGSGIFKKSKKTEYGIQKDFVGDMKLWEMSKAVKTFVDAADHRIDVIGFDVCLLGQLETVYQFKDLADYVIASELTEPGDGWNYWAAFEPMTANPDITPEEIAISITNTYVESYQPGGWQYRQASTQAATSVNTMNTEFIPLFNDFSDILGDLCFDYKSEITNARYSAWAAISIASNSEQNPDHRDLGGFLYELAENTSLPSILTESAQNTLDKYNKMIVAEGHTESITNGATGLKIWMPETMSTEGYSNIYYNDPENYLIINYTQWDEFLRKYENPVNTEAPVAEFYVQDTVEKGISVTLKNRSYYGPTSYNWQITPTTYEFINGTSATSKNPEIEFLETGKYTIQLDATNSYGTNTQIQDECIAVIKPDFNTPSNLSFSQDENIITLNWDYTIEIADFEEGFEDINSFPPQGWAIMSNDNLTGSNLQQVAEGANTWGWCDENTFHDQSGNPDPQYIHSGDYSAAIGYTAGQTGDPFNWLITPEITLRTNEVLSFWLWYASDASYYTDFDVMIFADNVWTSLMHLTDGSNVNLYEDQITISLSDYNEKIVKIAFVYQYTDGYQLAIDDILISNSKTKKQTLVKSNNKPLRIGQLKPATENNPKTSKVEHIASCFNIYRNNVKIGTVSELTSFTYNDTLTEQGTYQYYVTMLYSSPEGESDPTNTISVTYSTVNGINDLTDKNFSVYPNPANDFIQIISPEDFNHGVIQIIDLSGKIQFEKDMNSTESIIDITTLKQGMYIIKLYDSNNIFINRFIKK